MNSHYIQYYDNVVDKTFCDDLIDFFEEKTEHHEKIQFENHHSFTQIQLQLHTAWNKFSDLLYLMFIKHIDKYIEDCNIEKMIFPTEYSFELFRLKRYLPNGIDEFQNHVDVGNHATAKRFLGFFLYLNDNKGGHTIFPNYNIEIAPKQGRLLMFPPMWTHLHAGLKPVETSKYIIGSYLHYV